MQWQVAGGYPGTQGEEALCSNQVVAKSSVVSLQLTSHIMFVPGTVTDCSSFPFPPEHLVFCGHWAAVGTMLCIRECHGAWARLFPPVGQERQLEAQVAVTPRHSKISGGNGSGGSGTCLANKKCPYLKCSQSCCVSVAGSLIHTLTSINLF